MHTHTHVCTHACTHTHTHFFCSSQEHTKVTHCKTIFSLAVHFPRAPTVKIKTHLQILIPCLLFRSARICSKSSTKWETQLCEWIWHVLFSPHLVYLSELFFFLGIIFFFFFFFSSKERSSRNIFWVGGWVWGEHYTIVHNINWFTEDVHSFIVYIYADELLTAKLLGKDQSCASREIIWAWAVMKFVSPFNRCDPQKLAAVCREASALFCQAAVCSAVQKAVREGLRQVFGDGTESKRVAVRSSAAGKIQDRFFFSHQHNDLLCVVGHRPIFFVALHFSALRLIKISFYVNLCVGCTFIFCIFKNI